jgi:hypothetical protein
VNASRQRGLRLMQQFRRMSDAAQFRDFDEGAKTDEIHGHSYKAF